MVPGDRDGEAGRLGGRRLDAIAPASLGASALALAALTLVTGFGNTFPGLVLFSVFALFALQALIELRTATPARSRARRDERRP